MTTFFTTASVSHQLMFITMFLSSVNLARWLLFAWQEEIYKLFFTDVAPNAYDNLWQLYDTVTLGIASVFMDHFKVVANTYYNLP